MKYNVDTVAEHSLIWELLPEKANILDLGCRGFQFTNYLRDKGHHVVAVDADFLPEGDYIKAALWDRDGYVMLEKPNNDNQAVRVKPEGMGNMGSLPTRAITFKTLCQLAGIEFWDLIKVDIEGAELQFISNLTKAPAKQLSIEFHLHTGVYTQNDVGAMELKLQLLGYEKVHHKLTEAHGCGYNYWDSLFILP